MKCPVRKRKTAADEVADRKETRRKRRPYEPPRVKVYDATASILGPLASPTADGASGAFRP